MNKLSQWYLNHPLKAILLVAFALRMISVVFAQGYGMHDDHFLIIETSRSWASGWDFQKWLQDVPLGHSFTYPLLMFFLFKLLMAIGIEDLICQMYIVRFLHAALSLLTIYFSYRIVFRITNDRKTANITGWALSFLWCLPWLDVRNLVEVVCMPFLLWSTWLYIRNDNPDIKDAILSGIVMGIAMAFRYQILFFIGGFGLAMLLKKQYKNAIYWSISVIVIFSLTQISDIFIWHRPFAEMQAYIEYNLYNSGRYPQGGFFKYIGVLLGILVPPISVLLIFGFFYGYKRLFLFWPSMFFLFFHSIFPNKQERFIFPIIPFIIILGIIGLREFIINHPSNQKFRKTLRVCLIISLVINTILLIPLSFHYSKRSRVETMAYMSRYAPKVQSFIYEDSPNNDYLKMPRIYSNQNIQQFNVDTTLANVVDSNFQPIPAFVIFANSKDINNRVANMQRAYPHLVYETTIKPSLLDVVMQKINRHNRNYTYILYRNQDILPNKQ